MANAAFSISGMSCGHCLNRVNNTLRQVEGITAQQVQIGSARVDFDPARTSPARIAEAISKSGYKAEVVALP
ncbi:MAG TPA: cation transporter [Gemmatimonadales bacterium]|nr:cation transporter [Gemmatimonadales bacterium]